MHWLQVTMFLRIQTAVLYITFHFNVFIKFTESERNNVQRSIMVLENRYCRLYYINYYSHVSSSRCKGKVLPCYSDIGKWAGRLYEMLLFLLIFLRLPLELSLHPAPHWCLEAALPLQINLSYCILGSRSSKLQLLSRPHTFWKYFSTQDGTLEINTRN